MKVQEIAPAVAPSPLLPGAQFVDSFQIAVDGLAIDARGATERMLTQPPWWVDALLRLRNLLVAPFGLKAARPVHGVSGAMIGIFPVISETPERLVAGFDDKHLDFRVVVDVAIEGTVRRVTATTLVRTHNRLGRTYLAIILPFHRVIVQSMLRRVAT